MFHKTLKRKAVRLFARNSATGHWRYQRLTAVALVPLTVWQILFLASALNEPYLQTLSWLANPVNSIAIMAWVVIVFYHAALGVQVVLEDYISCLSLRKRAIFAANGVFLVFGLTAVAAILFTLYQVS
jgi:succinate dehydrogenase / fumarate reductase membrane anchor subunit